MKFSKDQEENIKIGIEVVLKEYDLYFIEESGEVDELVDDIYEAVLRNAVLKFG